MRVLFFYKMEHVGKPEDCAQLTFTCPKLTTETLEKGVKYVLDIVLIFLLLTLKIFHTFF